MLPIAPPTATDPVMPMGAAARPPLPIFPMSTPAPLPISGPAPASPAPPPVIPTPGTGGAMPNFPAPGAPAQPSFRWVQQSDGSAIPVAQGLDGRDVVLPGYARAPKIPPALQPPQQPA